MDRSTVYYGSLPRETDLLSAQQSAMVALAKMSEATLGTATAVDGFTVTPTTPASLNVILTPGSIYQQENLESSIWSSMPADLSHVIFKQGIQLDPITFGITPPATFGYSQVFLVQVQYQDVDSGALVLPYYNSSNPSSPFSGPGNSGSSQNTVRRGAIAAQVKAGVAATTGTQVTPSADAGWTALFSITVANGATSVSSGNISQMPAAPFIPVKLPQVPSSVQSGKWLYGVDTGTANAMVAVLNPVPIALVPGMTVRIKKGASANTGATTLDIGLGANSVKRATGADLSSGDAPGSTVAEFVWDGAYWQYANFQGFSATSTTVNNFTLTLPYALDSSVTANSIVASFTPAVTAVAAGDLFKVKLANNVTGASTVTINGLSPIPLKRFDGSATQYGDALAGEMLILVSDGTNLQLLNSVARGALQNVIYFNTSGTYMPSTKAKRVRVRGWSAGGAAGAGTSNNTNCAGGGGGGPSYFEKLYLASSLSASEGVVIGAGGANTTNSTTIAGDGGNTTFKGCTATGGKGGSPFGAGPYVGRCLGGLGGTATGGDLNISGGQGCIGGYVGFAGHGGGGFGVSAQFTADQGDSPVVATQGADGNFPGGGGAGTRLAGLAGGNGAHGLVIIEEYGEA